MYQLPPNLDPDLLRPAALEALTGMLVMHGSLPFIRVECVPEDDAACQTLAAVIDAIHVAEARRSPAAFVQYAFRHEENNEPIVNADHHIAWHEFLDAHDRAILFAPVEHAKTQHIAIGRVLWTLGTYPSKRIAIVSNTAEPHAIKILSSIRSHIQSNERVHRVFPALRRSTESGAQWGQYRITVQRDTIAKDPSIQSLGVYGPINGSRLDGIILDDILNFENTRTPEQIEKMIAWLDSEVLTRVTEGGWLHWIGTPWVPTDPMHQFASRDAWESQRWSGIHNPDDPMDEWQPLWPEQFSLMRFIKIRGGTSAINFARKYLCRVRDDADSRFAKAWIDYAEELGRNYKLFSRQPFGANGRPWRCFAGVDLATGKNRKKNINAKSVIFVVAIDERGRKVVADIQAGDWKAPEIIRRIERTVRDFGAHIYVEDNAAQEFILQWVKGRNLPVTGFTTTSNNKFDEHYGVESLAVEMRNGGWVIPSNYPANDPHPEIHAWKQEMLFYTPEAHTGDRLMASWLAREASRHAGFDVFGVADTLDR